MNKLANKVREMEGFSTVFKRGKAEEGDVVFVEKRRNKPKGKTISGASKMRAAYKSRMAKKR